MSETASPTVGDPVGIALSGIATGSILGASVITSGLLILRLIQGGIPTTDRPIGEFLFLTVTILLGIGTAVAASVFVMLPIPDLWRRGVAGVIAVFGMVILTALVAPIDMFGGPPAIAVYLVILIVLIKPTVAFARRARSTP